ncbi:hypothetical protein N9H60_02580 [Flavimaricola sp.]|nr:hypothetical protein [Flavimaricola sp.]MDA9020046.1 hypothetical protein [Flavimaricola sp.]
MMLENLYPRTKNDLVRAVQKMRISKIEVIDGYVPADERELVKIAKDLSAGSGDLTIVLIKS